MVLPLAIACSTAGCVGLTSATVAEITHGPFVGHTTPTQTAIWARASEPGEFELLVRRPGGPVVSHKRAVANVESDLCMVWAVDSLQPNTEYLYQIDCPGAVSVGGPEYRFMTSLRDRVPGVVRLAFGSCAKEDTGTGRVFHRMQQSKADAIVLLGDTPYIDSTKLATQRRRYGEFAAAPAVRRALAGTPWYGTWDDHDFGRNDTDGRLEGKENSRRAFVEYHANPSYGDGKRGVYTSFRRGPVEVFLLDTRSFAATEPSPFAADKSTLLGRTQWRWLECGLARSTAQFKILACGMIWNGATRPNKPDHWMSYRHERDALFRFIGDHRITGVVLIGGDIHRSRALRYPTQASAGYAITELITSPMHGSVIVEANAPHPNLLHDAGEPHSFLLLTVDSTCTPARADAQILNADGREIFSVTLHENDLGSDSYRELKPSRRAGRSGRR